MKIHHLREEQGAASVTDVVIGAGVGALVLLSLGTLTAALADDATKTGAQVVATSSSVDVANRIRTSVNEADLIVDVTDDRLTLDTTDAYGKTTRTVWTATSDGRVIESELSGPAEEIAGLAFDATLPLVQVHTNRHGADDVSFAWDGGDFVEYSIGFIPWTGAAIGTR